MCTPRQDTWKMLEHMEVAGGVWTLVPTSRVNFNFKIISVLSLGSNSFFLVVLVSLT